MISKSQCNKWIKVSKSQCIDTFYFIATIHLLNVALMDSYLLLRATTECLVGISIIFSLIANLIPDLPSANEFMPKRYYSYNSTVVMLQ